MLRRMTHSNLVPWIARVVLVAFGVWTAVIVVEHGYTGFLGLALAEDWAAQMLVDLVIALTVALGWLIGDARRRGVSPWPYVALTLVAGSIGPLLYLSLRSAPSASAARAQQAPVA